MKSRDALPISEDRKVTSFFASLLVGHSPILKNNIHRCGVMNRTILFFHIVCEIFI